MNRTDHLDERADAINIPQWLLDAERAGIRIPSWVGGPDAKFYVLAQLALKKIDPDHTPAT